MENKLFQLFQYFDRLKINEQKMGLGKLITNGSKDNQSLLDLLLTLPEISSWPHYELYLKKLGQIGVTCYIDNLENPIFFAKEPYFGSEDVTDSLEDRIKEEMEIAFKLKKIFKTNAKVRELCRRHNIHQLQVVEPLAAQIKHDGKVFMIYPFVQSNISFRDLALRSFILDLSEEITSNGIIPNDMTDRDCLIRQEEGKVSVWLTDLELFRLQHK